ncbi:hypothetical protein VNO77_44707 [Canavalia gladiata]|uniref:Uncharacterized protein n=1 Tax=Canavalia gladiata TaxID=3824 RepID=A0AAN9JYY1_CANGL
MLTLRFCKFAATSTRIMTLHLCNVKAMGAKRRSLRLNKTGTKAKKNEDNLNESMSSPSFNKAKCGNSTDLPPPNMPPMIVLSSSKVEAFTSPQPISHREKKGKDGEKFVLDRPSKLEEEQPLLEDTTRNYLSPRKLTLNKFVEEPMAEDNTTKFFSPKKKKLGPTKILCAIDHGTRLKFVVDLVIHPYNTIREDIINKTHHHLEQYKAGQRMQKF